jgi:uncharacterized repeat protein (TIGR01451 family)
MKRRFILRLSFFLGLMLPASVLFPYSGPYLFTDLCEGYCLTGGVPNPETSPGAIIPYSIYVTNWGDEDATNVTYHMVIPMYTTFDTASGYGWSCTGYDPGDTCSFNDGTVYANGDIDSYGMRVIVDDLVPCDLEYIEAGVTVTHDGVMSSPFLSASVRHKVNITGACIPTPSTSVCPSTPRYYMYTLEDANQPPGWQPYCYIISANGYPSVQIQASLCTPPGSQHTFKATNIPYGGWVYADCLGNARYGWPHWQPSWYRPEYAKSNP